MACRINCIHLLCIGIEKKCLFKWTNLLMVYTFFPVCLILYFSCAISYAYDAKFHEKLSERAIDYSVNYENALILTGLIDNAINIDDIDIEGNKPSYWFKLGSSAEDYIQIASAAEIDEDLIETVLSGVISGYGGLAKKILIQTGLAGAKNSLFSHFYNPLTDQGYSVRSNWGQSKIKYLPNILQLVSCII